MFFFTLEGPMKRIVSLFVVLVLLTLPLAAQTPDGVDAGSFVRDGIGGRAFGMGGTVVSIADDSSAAMWNPAGLAQLDGLSIGGMYSNKFGLGIHFQSVEATARVADFGVGLTMVRSSIQDIPYYDDDGAGGFFSDTQMLLLGSFGYDLGQSILDPAESSIDTLLVGGSVKYYTHSLLEGTGSGLGFDVGLLARFALEWGSLSLGYTSLDTTGTVLKWVGTDHEPTNHVPWINKFGISVGLFEESLRFAADADVAVGRSQLNRLHLGAEYSPIEELTVRGGAILSADGTRQFSTGGSLQWRGIALDYAYVPHAVLGGSHILSMQFGFAAWWKADEEDTAGDAEVDAEIDAVVDVDDQ